MIIKNDKSEIENYIVDSANYHGYCDAVYFPENEADIAQMEKVIAPNLILCVRISLIQNI